MPASLPVSQTDCGFSGWTTSRAKPSEILVGRSPLADRQVRPPSSLRWIPLTKFIRYTVAGCPMHRASPSTVPPYGPTARQLAALAAGAARITSVSAHALHRPAANDEVMAYLYATRRSARPKSEPSPRGQLA